MPESLKWKRICLLGTPIIRSQAWRITMRLGLRFHDRQDFEQELWLELLVRHCGRDHDDGVPGLLDGVDWLACRAAARAQLQWEVERISEALACSWPFWRRVRPAPERVMSSFMSAELSAADPHLELHHHDLSLDLAEFIAQLPIADRCLCESLMNDGADLQQSATSNSPDIERRLGALRNDFAAIGLNEYL